MILVISFIGSMNGDKAPRSDGLYAFLFEGKLDKMKNEGMIFLVHKVLLLFKFGRSHLPQILQINFGCVAG